MNDPKSLTIRALILLACLFLAFFLFAGCKKDEQGGTITVHCANVTKYTRVTISQGGYAVQTITSLAETMKSKNLPTGNYAVTANYSGATTSAWGGVYQVWANQETTVTLP